MTDRTSYLGAWLIAHCALVVCAVSAHAAGCDLNGDSQTTITDVQLCSNQAIGMTACGSGDVDGNTRCDVIDVQRVVNASLGTATCGSTPPPPPPSGGSCALPKYPTTACTGVPVGTTLTTVSGSLTASTAGQVIDGKRITGDLLISANNVVIKNSEILGRVRNTAGSYTIQDSIVGPTSGCADIELVGYENYTARRVYLRNAGDGFRVSGSNILIEDSFVDLCSKPGDHSDGIQGYGGGTNVIVRHNTIDQRRATDVTSPVFFADNSKSARVENNLLAGGGYTIRLHDDFTPDVGPWVATGNRVVDGSWVYGPVNNAGTNCATTTWSDNRLVTIDSNYNILTTGALVGCGG